VQTPVVGFYESLFSQTNKSGYYPKPKRKLITSSYDVIITSMTHHEHTRMTTILSQTHTSHIMLSTHPHNLINIST